MSYTENDIYSYLLNYIKTSKRSYFILNNILDDIGAEKKSMLSHIQTSKGYLDFYNAAKRLYIENIIIPIKESKENGMYPPLKVKFKKVKEKNDHTEINFRLMKLNKHININKYYLKNSAEFLADEKEIMIISQFLDNPSKVKMTINERSWELFGDEKYLKLPNKQAKGEVLLKKLGLTYEDLNCYYAYEPFIFFAQPNFNEKQNRRILIVENKDTFWSFHKLLFETKNTLNVDMLIYGEGKKIINSLKYFEKLAGNASDNILYFGDIDREGINIFFKLKEVYCEFAINAFDKLYENLLKSIDIKNIQKSKNNQSLVDGAKAVFLKGMDEKYHGIISKIIDNDLYIPQEAFNFEKMLKTYGKGELDGTH